MATVYLNGEYLPIDQACISVLDRGFIFGDGVYEVIPVYHGQPFHLKQHLSRLGSSLERIGLENPMTLSGWESSISKVIVKNDGGDLSVYLQITRGVMQQRDHNIKEGVTPTVLIMTSPLITYALKGIKAVTRDDTRCQLQYQITGDARQ